MEPIINLWWSRLTYFAFRLTIKPQFEIAVPINTDFDLASKSGCRKTIQGIEKVVHAQHRFIIKNNTKIIHVYIIGIYICARKVGI